MKDVRYVPLNKTVKELQHLLKDAAYTGEVEASAAEIINTVKRQPEYAVDKLIKQVTDALIAEDKRTNIIDGDGTTLVVVNKEKLDQVIDLIKRGGRDNGRRDEDEN